MDQSGEAASRAEERCATFQRRLERHGERLRANLQQLYGRSPGFENWYDALITAVTVAAEARPEALVDLDERREADPGWFLGPDMLGYSAYVDRFAGSLKGLRDRIGYLSGLGVRYLHLLPFWKTGAGDNDGGFAVSDYSQVRADLGDITDLEPLTAALRGSGISLCVDLVLNHTASNHAWALAALAGDERYRAYYHVLDDRALVDRYEAALLQIFPETAPGNFTKVEALGGWAWTTFYPFQWDLNWANPAVFGEFSAIILSLANHGVEAFRLDSAAFLWKRLGSDCRSQPETHLVLQALRAILAIAAPAVLLKSEVIGPVAETAQFLGGAEAPECHLTYHASLMTAGWAALAEGDAGLVQAVLDATPLPPPGTGWITYVRCHDDIGWMSLTPQAAKEPGEALDRLSRVAARYAQGGEGNFGRGQSFQSGDDDRIHGLNGTTASLAGLEAARDPIEIATALDRNALLHGLALAAGGLPVLYMGDEFGQLNDYAFESDPDRAHEGRWLHRPAFDEAAATASTDPVTLQGQIRARLAELLQARVALPALSPGTAPASLQTGTPAVLGFRRGQDHVALFNFSSQPHPTLLPAAGDAWRDLLSGALVQEGMTLKAYGMAWLARIGR